MTAGNTTKVIESLIGDASVLIVRAPLSRRGFGAVALAAGFAAAAGPARADAIATDASGLEAGAVAIPAAGGVMPGYRARPLGHTQVPVILVVQEIFGVHEHIRDVCRRFAKEGWYAVAPELYWRHGKVSDYEDLGKLVSELAAKVPDGEVMDDLDAAAAFASGEGGDTNRLSITGFCWGGRMTWLYAAHRKGLKAAVAWYGRLVGEKSELRPQHPVDIAGAVHCPVLGLYGGQDRGIPLETIEAMRAALIAGGEDESRIDVFPGSGHAFFADYRASYNADDAHEGWRRALAFLRQHGAG